MISDHGKEGWHEFPGERQRSSVCETACACRHLAGRRRPQPRGEQPEHRYWAAQLGCTPAALALASLGPWPSVKEAYGDVGKPSTAGSRSADAGGNAEPGRDSLIHPWRASTRRFLTKHLDQLPFFWLAGEAVPFIRSIGLAGKKSRLPFRHVNVYSRPVFWEPPWDLLSFMCHKSHMSWSSIFPKQSYF